MFTVVSKSETYIIRCIIEMTDIMIMILVILFES